MKARALLLTLFGLTEAAKTLKHDLDDDDVTDWLYTNGLTLTQRNTKAYFKVGKTDNTKQWFMDTDACSSVIDMKKNNDDADVFHIELTATKAGSCTMRIAYAQTWAWADTFTSQTKLPDRFIEVPVTVLQGSPSSDSVIQILKSGSLREDPCTEDRWACDIKEQL